MMHNWGKMMNKVESAVKERALLVRYNEFTKENLVAGIEKFRSLSQLHYSEQEEWNIDWEIDNKTNLPRLTNDSGSIVHYDFSKKTQSGGIAYSFRIFPSCVIFNFSKRNIQDSGCFGEMLDSFTPHWEQFCDCFGLEKISSIKLCYLLVLDESTLTDGALYRKDWLEVKEISSLFSLVNQPAYDDCIYVHPFSCEQNWQVKCVGLPNPVRLCCDIRSKLLKSPRRLSMFVDVSAKTDCESCDFRDKFDLLFGMVSDLYNITLTDKAKSAIKGDWK